MSTEIIDQHLIDPEICIRCNTCEATCPVGAITHDSRNYVVDAEICNLCMACVPPCPTGSIDNWRKIPKSRAYSIEEQLIWDILPEALAADALAEMKPAESSLSNSSVSMEQKESSVAQSSNTPLPMAKPVNFGSTIPPWSAAHPYVNLYGPKSAVKSVKATIVGNFRVTEVGSNYDTHHIVLDFHDTPFPVLEGQSIGIIPPGTDDQGKAHHARQYSIASPRNGERPEYNNLSLTIKRVLEDHAGNPVKGVASNFMCDSQIGDQVEVIGPFGSSFLMPNHPESNIIMICTGTGSAPMRAMTEWRRRLRQTGKFKNGQLMLFFGARTQAELPYFGPLQNLPTDFIDINLAFSRTPNEPKKYVQDAMLERAQDLVTLLKNPNTYVYVCGLKAMEDGVIKALEEIIQKDGLNWNEFGNQLKLEGRLHLETY
ncbi:benzoyl-CoA 2,3-epoxidase subunit BoxA [Polynucleobacter kasalickyi]|uniref:Benzoyl-CoA oxygenase component A n=1 Tax=Polynucleobacter kasalickyi TaxID=1938817 RepID=A0A1W1ZGJ1_9BURK|nr:benzoyl-CoA 2,3-epoxidase subunit BoxA [Polynucleobacter kasalickyi]SMC47630.1 benzoyl-CoA oxygenase, component A [Polynucleobacter kasalickyi]